MSKLALSVRQVEGEAAFSLASRLATRNGIEFSEFLRDMGMSLGQLLDGGRSTLDRLADLAGVDAEDLRQNTPMLEATGRMMFRGHVFPASALRGTTIRGCKSCLGEELQNDGGEGAVIQGLWLLSHVTICLRHGVPLEPLWTETPALRGYDSAVRLLEFGDDLLDFEKAEAQRESTGFERWLQERLEGRGSKPIWLDRFSLHGASLFCAELGRAVIATRLPKWKKLASEDLWWPSAVGFDLCEHGEARMLQALTQLQQMMGRPEHGPKKIFGQLHECLAANPLQDDLIPFRDIFRRHIAATWPLGPGDELLGEPVLTRQLHSVLTAARLTGRSGAEIRCACSKAGLISEAAAGLPDAWAVFDAKAAAPLLDELAEDLSDDAFCKALGATEGLFDALQSSGLLDAARRKDGIWNPVQGQALLDRLLLGAETIYVPMHGWVDISAAARALNRSPAEIIAMIHGGRLPRLGRYVQREGFASILVDLASVADGENAISVGIFAISQGIPKGEMLNFLKRELMPLHGAPPPKGGREQRALSPKKVADFHRDFISYRKLGIAAGLTWTELDRVLDRHAIRPVAGCRRIYRRAQVSALISAR